MLVNDGDRKIYDILAWMHGPDNSTSLSIANPALQDEVKFSVVTIADVGSSRIGLTEI